MCVKLERIIWLHSSLSSFGYCCLTYDHHNLPLLNFFINIFVASWLSTKITFVGMRGGTVPAVSSIRVAEAKLQSKDPGLKTKRTEL